MPRVSARERARRQAIARGVRRYWRRVHAIERRLQIVSSEARAVYREQIRPREREIPFLQALGELVLPTIFEPVGLAEGEFAFNLQDVDERVGLRFYEQSRGKTEVEVVVNWEYRETPQSEEETGQATIRFDPGATREEFWSNYFAALRAFHDETIGDRSYDKFGIFVSRMR
jgi:hypothetical protein